MPLVILLGPQLAAANDTQVDCMTFPAGKLRASSSLVVSESHVMEKKRRVLKTWAPSILV
jgi:hypothetical protein